MAVKSKKISAATSAVQAFDAGDAGSDPDVPVRPGTGTAPSVYIHLASKETMGWKLFPKPKGETTSQIVVPAEVGTIIFIPEDSEWKLAEDFNTGNMYVDIDKVFLKEASVENMVDEMGKDVPTKQNRKVGKQWGVTFRLKKTA